MPPVSEAKESVVVGEFLANSENTMNSVVSASVGIAILRLANHYFGANPDDSFIQTRYQDCIEQLKESKELSQEALDYIIQKTEEPINPFFDRLTLFINSRESIFQISLKEVLTLVWLGLNDDSKYTHHYSGTEEEKLKAAKENKFGRLKGLTDCLEKMKSHPVCHHGNRNELVFLLNGTYRGIHLIEDGRSAVLFFLKDWIFEKFWKLYEKSKRRAALTQAILEWIFNDDISLIFVYSDPGKKYFEELNQLFISHGINPKITLVQGFIADALQSVAFSCDPQQHQAFWEANAILHSEEKTDTPSRDQARSRVLSWFKQQVDFEKPFPEISSFYEIDRARTAFSRCEVFLRVSGSELLDEAREFAAACDSYFQKINQKNNFVPIASEELIERAKRLLSSIEKAKKDSLSSAIENFFADWFSAKKNKEQDNLKHLYAMLLDQKVRPKIVLTDKELDAFELSGRSLEAGARYRDITPYEINRIFLHAILETPEKWTSLFLEKLKRVLDFVKNDFNHAELRGVFGVLKRDSYPQALLAQLDYLLSKRENRQPEPERPKEMILLPEQVKTADEWIALVGLLEAKKHEEFCRSHLGVLVSAFRKKLPRVENVFLFFQDFLKTVSFISRENFINQCGLKLKPLIKSTQMLGYIVDLLPIDKRISFIEKVFPVAGEIVKTGSDLIWIVKKLPQNKRKGWVKSNKFDFKKLITNTSELSDFLSLFSLENRHQFVLEETETFNRAVEFDKGLGRVLRLFPTKDWLPLSAKLKWQDIIKNQKQLTRFFSSFSQEAQADALALIPKKVLSSFNNKRPQFFLPCNQAIERQPGLDKKPSARFARS